MAKKNNNRPYYNEAELANVRNIDLPQRIKCCRCSYVKGQACFSAKRLLDLKVAIRKDRRYGAPTTKYIPCSKCTGHQVTEMECYMCDTVYDLDKFAKNQRKTPDAATCWRCMEDRLNDEPFCSDDEEFSGSNVGDYDSDEEGTQGGGTTTLGTSSNLGSSSGGVGLSIATLSLKSTTANKPAASNQSFTTSSVYGNGPSSVASSTPQDNRKFAKNKAVPTRHVFEGAERVRKHNASKREDTLENITLAARSDSESD